MMRGTFANIRHQATVLAFPAPRAAVTQMHMPGGEQTMSIYDAAMRYKAEGVTDWL